MNVAANGSGTDTWKKDYVYRGSQLLASISPEGTRHFHLDHLGTSRVVTDESGGLVAYHTYYPFGREATPEGVDGERMQYTGHERDQGAGVNDLDYMHARYYSPELGRFLGVDPALSQSRTFLGSPAFGYVYYNPVRLIDPNGEQAVDGTIHHLGVTVIFDRSGPFEDRVRMRSVFERSVIHSRHYFNSAGITFNITETGGDVEIANGFFNTTINGFAITEWYRRSGANILVVVTPDFLDDGQAWEGVPIILVGKKANRKVLAHELLHLFRGGASNLLLAIFEELAIDLRLLADGPRRCLPFCHPDEDDEWQLRLRAVEAKVWNDWEYK